MAHPTYWPTNSYYYPVGNTPPVCLTQHLSPEEDADVLLLGCGDPRHVLYTIFASGADQVNAARRLDFTCCDVEPAILARNALLFTLVADADYSAQKPEIWDIFYHFYLDDKARALLIVQCRKLVNLSKDVETWNAGPYAPFLRLCSRYTLTELRRHWSKYLEMESRSDAQRRALKKTIDAGMKKVSLDQMFSLMTTAGRGAGPLWQEAEIVGDRAHKHFWRTGTTHTAPDAVARATHVNPTFAYATKGEGFVAHYGTAPLAAFHLAPMLARLRGPKVWGATVGEAFAAARGQFEAWCGAFRACVLAESPTVVVRLFVGDALAFCHTLNYLGATGRTTSHHRVSHWKTALLDLDSGDYAPTASHRAPHVFNVIDTSNLSDHLGMLNVLVAATPILSRTPSATLHTETLLASDGKDSGQAFTDGLCGDITTISLLFDLVPAAFASNFTSESNVHEILSSFSQVSQFHERTSWKIPSLLDRPGIQRRVHLDTQEAAQLLFSIYHRMFAAAEDLNLIQARMRDPELARQAQLNSRDTTSQSRYSLILLLKFLSTRLSVDWTEVLHHFLGHIENDRRLILGSNFYQEIICQLHLLGMYSAATLLPSSSMLDIKLMPQRLRSWGTMPPVVCMLLVIPQKKMLVLEESGMPSNVNLHAVVRGHNFLNAFSHIQTSFGAPNIQDGAFVDLKDDPLGKLGSSSTVVAFWVPSWMLGVRPQSITVALALQSTPGATSRALVSKLGMDLEVFSAPLTDPEHVHILREMPPSSTLRQSLLAVPPCYPPSASLPVFSGTSEESTLLTLDKSSKSSVATLTGRADVVDPQAKEALGDRSSSVDAMQISATQMSATIASQYTQNVCLPYPVDGANAKLRVARKSSYIEVVAPLSGPRTDAASAVNPFPLIHHRGSLVAWNIHRLNLKRLPLLDTTGNISWLSLHLFFMFSDQERPAQTSGVSRPLPTRRTALTDIKTSIHTMLDMFSRPPDVSSRVFGLNCESAPGSTGGLDTLIFVMGLRLDNANHTVVADCCILPITKALLDSELGREIELLTPDIVQLQVNDRERILWKQLTPAVVERCREWKHRDDCAYLEGKKIPLTVEHAADPICRCGRGQGTDGLSKVKKWAPFAPHATRAAISPLFAVSYLDRIVRKETLDEVRAVLAGRKSASVSARGSTSSSSSHTTTPVRDTTRCANCGDGAGQLQSCARCKKVVYCSKTCQMADWKKHKPACSR
ncbi:hypothetical protein PLICRDRAFT_56433 [Plicaturopsis crispa FD-325 SS-3]|nr:hypothetical protein PLICRDRAFT_56433 [Plicaturopsis crispa FD-325 SS-3]